jgi:nicotinic acid mononucleotide adenylyltransferase
VDSDDIEARLAAINETEHPVVERFDAGAPLKGRLAFLPSAFNPPTIGHLRLLEAARALDGVDAVTAMLTTRNVAKGIYGAGLADRVGMLLALHRHWPVFAVTAANAARIMDQAEALSRATGAGGVDAIVGFDTLERLFDPQYYSDMERELTGFFERHRVIAANRGRETAERVTEWVERNAGPFGSRILVREIDEEASLVSSTDARNLAENPEDMPVAPPVREYIERRGLYR